MFARPLSHRHLFATAVFCLASLAWVTLWLWGRSPYGRYLNHAELANIALDVSPSYIAGQAGLYVAGWLLMTTAMMLPTTVPLLQVFARLVSRRANRSQLLWLVVAGYLAIWLAFGIAAHLVDLGLHKLYDHSGWLQANVWIFGAGPLMLAGAFQFSSLKYRCLDKCRSPLSFVMQYWRGRRERWHAFLLGVHHGAFCVGCCWALMFLMFAVGMGSLGWMLVLACVMAVEKNSPWGRSLAVPLGIVLLVWGLLIAVNHTYTWQG